MMVEIREMVDSVGEAKRMVLTKRGSGGGREIVMGGEIRGMKASR